MKKFVMLFYAHGSDEVVAQVCVSARDHEEAHRLAFKKISQEHPGFQPEKHDHYLTRQVYSFNPPDAT